MEASYSVDLNANDDQAHVDMQTNSSSSRPTRRKKIKTRKMLEVEKTHLLAKMYEGNNEIIEIFKRGEKRRDERFAKMANELEKRYQLKMLQVENERNKYELEHEEQEKEIMEKNLNSISNPFECEYFKVKKMEIIEKITCKSRQSGLRGHSDGNFINCNEYNGGNYRGDLLSY